MECKKYLSFAIYFSIYAAEKKNCKMNNSYPIIRTFIIKQLLLFRLEMVTY